MDNLKNILCKEYGVYIYYIKHDEDINKSMINLAKNIKGTSV